MSLRPVKWIKQMSTRWVSILVAAAMTALFHAVPAVAQPPAARIAVLARGINVTHWFRFVPDRRARSMSRYMDDPALAALKRAGFTYVRLAVGPEEVMEGQHIAPDMLQALAAAIGRIERSGLGVMIEPHPEMMQHWNLQRDAGAREKLFGFWRDLAPVLRRFPAAMTFPELVNEPSLDDPAQWDALQARLVTQLRTTLPDSTVILTGTNWSSIDGLLKVRPIADRNVVYSFHTYEPQVLTLLAFWDSAVNKHQLAANIPFPASDPAKCAAAIAPIADRHTHDVAKYWCSLHQDDASVERNLSRAVQWGKAHDASVAMTEFGASSELNAKARLAYLYAVRHSAEQLGLPWGIWGLDDQMGFGHAPAGLSTPDQLSAGVMQALGLAHHHVL